MIRDIRSIITSLKYQALKVDLKLLTDGIRIPEATEEFDTFSIQGRVRLNTPVSRTVKSVIIQFSGSFIDLKGHSKKSEKSAIIENQSELLKDSLQVSPGTSIFEFELALPKSLPSSANTDFFKLNYTISTIIDFGEEQVFQQIPVQVYNSHLIPHLSGLLYSYQHSGAIKDIMNYKIKFSKRLYTIDESVNFRVKIDSNKNVRVNSITASLLQKDTIFNGSNPGSENENSHNLTLNRDIQIIRNTSGNHQNQFNLSLRSKLNKRVLMPSMSSTFLEVKHTIEILINYQLQGQGPKIRFIQVPVSISSKPSQFSMDDLPTYNKIELNSTHIPVAELPPVYCN